MITDLRSPAAVENVLDYVEGALGVSLDRASATYGWRGKTAGFATQASPRTWVRIACRPAGEMNERIWTGEECASVLTGVAKPTLLRSVRWLDAAEALVWRADELSYARSVLISATPEITVDPALPGTWWAELSMSLAALADHRTVRVGVRQDLVNRRVAEIAGGSVDPTVEEWATAHADLHWANLTGPTCEILDWEGWGAGPRGLDAATLWGYSLAVPALVERIETEFTDDFATRSGKIAQLFTCAELLRMVVNFGDHPGLKGPLTLAARHLADELRP
ncbi:MAG: hypothetical protein WCF33_00190 [Pseudonocardiaceae bacterium]